MFVGDVQYRHDQSHFAARRLREPADARHCAQSFAGRFSFEAFLPKKIKHRKIEKII